MLINIGGNLKHVGLSSSRDVAAGSGTGIHHCLGAALARLEGRIVFEMLLERFSRISLLDERPRFRKGIVLRSLEVLAVQCVRPDMTAWG